MITIKTVEDGGVDLDCTIEDFVRIRRLVSDATENFEDISELRNMPAQDVADLDAELAQFHDVPVPLEQNYALRLAVVIDAMRHRRVPGLGDEDRRRIVRAFDAINWP
ncbi:hypothetical protein ACRARG_20805 [Pseudooceanicola sp. C21-150M6]|uniref:hypothetical protein n=1 Tax=Pseudooceanicola sp. C21-150M6 TaxID=3434355 RepID=UPI003D7FB875